MQHVWKECCQKRDDCKSTHNHMVQQPLHALLVRHLDKYHRTQAVDPAHHSPAAIPICLLMQTQLQSSSSGVVGGGEDIRP